MAALEASPPIFHIDRVARAIVLSPIIVDAYFLLAAFRACDHVIPLQKRVHLTLYMLTPAVPINRIGSGTRCRWARPAGVFHIGDPVATLQDGLS